MAKLTREESQNLIQLFVKSQNKLKGQAIDQARMALPEIGNDRQFNQFRQSIKGTEASIRVVFLDALEQLGLVDPQDRKDMEGMK